MKNYTHKLEDENAELEKELSDLREKYIKDLAAKQAELDTLDIKHMYVSQDLDRVMNQGYQSAQANRQYIEKLEVANQALEAENGNLKATFARIIDKTENRRILMLEEQKENLKGQIVKLADGIAKGQTPTKAELALLVRKLPYA